MIIRDVKVTASAPTYDLDGSRGYYYLELTGDVKRSSGWIYRADDGKVWATIDSSEWQFVGVSDGRLTVGWIDEHAGVIAKLRRG